jgi:uncharacterized membrane protein
VASTTNRSKPSRSASLRRRNIAAIADIERQALDKRSPAGRFSDALTQATGSAPFGVVHLVWFIAWLAINSGHVRWIKPFDPFPFSLLTLIVSLEAIFLTVFVLMSQNRMARQGDKRAHLDLQVDLLAEQELTLILYLVRSLCEKQGVRFDNVRDQLGQLLKETDVQELASDLDADLPEA